MRLDADVAQPRRRRPWVAAVERADRELSRCIGSDSRELVEQQLGAAGVQAGDDGRTWNGRAPPARSPLGEGFRSVDDASKRARLVPRPTLVRFRSSRSAWPGPAVAAVVGEGEADLPIAEQIAGGLVEAVGEADRIAEELHLEPELLREPPAAALDLALLALAAEPGKHGMGRRCDRRRPSRNPRSRAPCPRSSRSRPPASRRRPAAAASLAELIEEVHRPRSAGSSLVAVGVAAISPRRRRRPPGLIIQAISSHQGSADRRGSRC